MAAWQWVALVAVTWFLFGFMVALVLGRLLAPTWWERLAEDIADLPEYDDCPTCLRWRREAEREQLNDRQ